MQFLSTLSLRRATMQIVIIVVDTVISIHALLAESDFMFSVVFYLENIFLSTLSLRRATTCGGGWNEQPRYFYPRSPCGERRQAQSLKVAALSISIHALLAESDRHLLEYPYLGQHFYPRSPCGERLWGNVRQVDRVSISIHALLAESDHSRTVHLAADAIFLSTLSLRRATGSVRGISSKTVYFYPRSPCGERRWRCAV